MQYNELDDIAYDLYETVYKSDLSEYLDGTSNTIPIPYCYEKYTFKTYSYQEGFKYITKFYDDAKQILRIRKLTKINELINL
jgi:hypothetical protein